MSKTYVMTLRLPKDLGLGLERYAARTGHKPAQLGAVAVDEFMRRRSFPLIDFRETAAGRVAYVKGTRLAVYWLVEAIRRIKGEVDWAAERWELTPEKIRMALHYAETYPEEMQTMREHARANRAWLEKAESAMKKAKALGRSAGREITPIHFLPAKYAKYAKKNPIRAPINADLSRHGRTPCIRRFIHRDKNLK